MKEVVVLSGGLDSTILLYLMVSINGADDVTALTFDYGQRHDIEIDKALSTCIKLGVKHKVIDITFLGDMVSGASALIQGSKVELPTVTTSLGDPQPLSYVPNRNFILFGIAASFAESICAEKVYLGLQAHDTYGYWDTTPEFLEAINNIMNLNRKNKIQLHAPFINMDKAEEIELGITLQVPFEDTWTCYEGGNIEQGIACGKCLSCGERIGNFIKAKVKDPIPYAIPIDWEKEFMNL